MRSFYSEENNKNFWQSTLTNRSWGCEPGQIGQIRLSTPALRILNRSNARLCFLKCRIIFAWAPVLYEHCPTCPACNQSERAESTPCTESYQTLPCRPCRWPLDDLLDRICGMDAHCTSREACIECCLSDTLQWVSCSWLVLSPIHHSTLRRDLISLV